MAKVWPVSGNVVIKSTIGPSGSVGVVLEGVVLSPHRGWQRQERYDIFILSWIPCSCSPQWIITSNGPNRLPARGPGIPLGDFSLLMVTQDNYVHLTYFYRHIHGLRTVKRSLQFQGASREQTLGPDYGEIPNSTKHCVDAAIGFGYNGKNYLSIS